jgi:nucleotide-binding universal stress UspA family protein
MIKRILIATDFSPMTRRAEEYAMSVAKALGSKVTVLHAIEPVEGAEGDKALDAFIEARKDRARADCDAVVARFTEAGVEAESRIELGKRWKTISDLAADNAFDLVVLGSHKIHDGNKVYLSTTTHKVFFSADVPLLVVPSN